MGQQVLKITLSVAIFLAILTGGGYFYVEKYLFQSTDSAQIKGLGVVSVGEYVKHKKFGTGVIKAIHQNGESHSVQINFKEYGRKWLIAEFAPLSIENDSP